MKETTPFLRKPGGMYYFRYRDERKHRMQKCTNTRDFEQACLVMKAFLSKVKEPDIPTFLDELRRYQSIETNPKYREAQIDGSHYSRKYSQAVTYKAKKIESICKARCPEILLLKLDQFTRRDARKITEAIVEDMGHCRTAQICQQVVNGSIGELIIVDPFVSAMKNTVGHPIYEIRRLLWDVADKPETSESQRIFCKENFFRLKGLSKEIYTNHNWELESNSKALSAEITELDSGKELVAGVSTSLDEVLSNDNLTNLQPLLVKAFNSKPSSDSHRINLESYLSNSERLNIRQSSTSNKAQNDMTVNTLYQSAYHGSGAEFNQFLEDKIGSANNGATYGYGFYVTDSDLIGKEYARAGQFSQESRDGMIQQWVERRDSALNKIKEYEKEMEQYDIGENDYIILDDTIHRLSLNVRQYNSWINKFNSKPIQRRNLYKLTIPDNTGENYLNWDKKATKSTKRKIYNSLYEELSKGEGTVAKQEMKKELTDLENQNDTNGGQIYNNLIAYLTWLIIYSL